MDERCRCEIKHLYEWKRMLYDIFRVAFFVAENISDSEQIVSEVQVKSLEKCCSI